MNKVAPEELVQIARTWVVKHSPDTSLRETDISVETNLLESGMLDSVGLVELLALLENTTGNKIDLLDLAPEDFSTLAGLCNAALQPEK